MAVLKNKLKQDFTIVANQAIEDQRLTPIEFRLYCYLCSRPENWDINNTDIQNKLNIKTRHTLAKYWKKLISLGLISRQKAKGQQGMFGGFDYIIHDYPCVNEPHTEPCVNGSNMDSFQHGSINTYSNTKYLNKTDFKQN